MTVRRLGAAWSVLLAVLLAGCSAPVGLYHRLEGGAIAQNRQPPPGAEQPYPNLADVPATPPPAGLSAAQINARAAGAGVSPPSPAALAGLSLPAAAPPLPDVPGIRLPASSAAAPPPAAPAAAAPPAPASAPIALAFPAHSAILPVSEAAPLAALAVARGNATCLVGGFGDGTSLKLAIARAQRLADALTAAGVPPAAIRLVSAQAGSGGFVQIVY